MEYKAPLTQKVFQEACRFSHVAILKLIIQSAKAEKPEKTLKYLKFPLGFAQNLKNDNTIDKESFTESINWKEWLFNGNFYADESMIIAIKKENKESKMYEMGQYLLSYKYSEEGKSKYPLYVFSIRWIFEQIKTEICYLMIGGYHKFIK